MTDKDSESTDAAFACSVRAFIRFAHLHSYAAHTHHCQSLSLSFLCGGLAHACLLLLLHS